MRIDVERSRPGKHYQVHVLHGNRPEKNLISQHESARKADAVLETQLDGPDVGNKPARAIGDGDFLFVDLVELELNAHMFRDAQVQRAGIRERFNLNGIKLRLPRIRQRECAGYKAHGCSLI